MLPLGPLQDLVLQAIVDPPHSSLVPRPTLPAMVWSQVNDVTLPVHPESGIHLPVGTIPPSNAIEQELSTEHQAERRKLHAMFVPMKKLPYDEQN